MQAVHDIEPELARKLAVEHICLESDSEQVPAAGPQRRVRSGPAFRFESKVRGSATELAFSTDHHLSILQTHFRQPIRKYVVDLRFIDTAALAEIRLAWRWWLATMALSGLSVICVRLASRPVEPQWDQVALHASIVIATVAACVALLALRRTGVVIALHSVHGEACLGTVYGSLRGIRSARSFIAELSRRVEVSRRVPSQSKAHFLRDEMREHHRLSQEGILSSTVYEASKRRILASHA